VRHILATALLCPLLGAAPVPARELWRSGETSLELSGSVRELAIATRGTDAGDFEDAARANPAVAVYCARAETFPDCPAFEEVGEQRVLTSLTRLRTRLDLRLSPHWSAVAVYDHELRAGTLDTFEADLSESLASESFLGAEGVLERSDHVRWSHLLYRGFVLFESPHFEFTLGRGAWDGCGTRSTASTRSRRWPWRAISRRASMRSARAGSRADSRLWRRFSHRRTTGSDAPTPCASTASRATSTTRWWRVSSSGR
jgi:hypothetical protein